MAGYKIIIPQFRIFKEIFTISKTYLSSHFVWIDPGHKGSSRRWTNGLSIISVEYDTFCGQPIDVRRDHIRIHVPDVIETLTKERKLNLARMSLLDFYPGESQSCITTLKVVSFWETAKIMAYTFFVSQFKNLDKELDLILLSLIKGREKEKEISRPYQLFFARIYFQYQEKNIWKNIMFAQKRQLELMHKERMLFINTN